MRRELACSLHGSPPRVQPATAHGQASGNGAFSPTSAHGCVGGALCSWGTLQAAGVAQRGSLGVGWGVGGRIWGYSISRALLPTPAELVKWRPWRIQRVAFVSGYCCLRSAISPTAGNIVSLSIRDFFWPRADEGPCGDPRRHVWPCHRQEAAPSHQPHPGRTCCSSPPCFHCPHMWMHIQTMHQNNRKANHHWIASPHSWVSRSESIAFFLV